MPLALNVCMKCRSRKRACDKQLPHCGYCKSRGFPCQYDYAHEFTSSYRTAATGQRAVVDLLFDQTSPIPSAWSDLTAVHGAVDCEIRRVLSTIGATLNEVVTTYFRSFHPWLPIVSPQLALEVDRPKRADTAVLLLAMCVVSRHPISDDTYATLRVLFSQAQVFICASLRLVQAQLLIAVFEYSRGWRDMADLSITCCARMASMLHINRCRVLGVSQKEDESIDHSRFERWNVWWGIIILETAIMSDSLDVQNSPISRLPEPGLPLPIDLNDQTALYGGGCRVLGCFASKSNDTGDFGRLAEAASLLHRVLEVHRQQSHSTLWNDHSEALDKELQSFLLCIMAEEEAFPQRRAGTIAVIVRSLFILHQANLALPIHLTTDESRQRSWAVLNTVTNIVVDTAQSHTENAHCFNHSHLALPLCCARNVRDAKQYVDNVHFYRNTNGQTEVSEYLEVLE